MSFKTPDRYRIARGSAATRPGQPFGAFMVPPASPTLRAMGRALHVIAHHGRNDIGLPVWEHVSVSMPDRCPSWDDMCLIKGLFWDAEDCVLQFHPPASSYVNDHPFVLHLWRPAEISIPLPPRIFV